MYPRELSDPDYDDFCLTKKYVLVFKTKEQTHSVISYTSVSDAIKDYECKWELIGQHENLLFFRLRR